MDKVRINTMIDNFKYKTLEVIDTILWALLYARALFIHVSV